MAVDVGFLGVELPKGVSKQIVADYDGECYETIHLTQVALGAKPAKGPHTLFIEDEQGEKFAIGTLNKDTCPHFSIDITLATDSITMFHTGDSSVYVTGYRAQQMLPDDDEEDEDEDLERVYADLLAGQESSSEEESGDEGDKGSDDEPPQAVPLLGANGRGRAFMDDQAEIGSSDEEESSDDEDEEDDDEGSSEEEEKEKALARRKAGKKNQLAAMDEDSSEEDDSEEEDEESDEEEEKEKVVTAKRKAKALATPQPVKKAKAAEAKAPATAPAKVDGGGAMSGSEAAYAKAVVAFLQQNGPSKLAALGQMVKRPPKSPKLKNFVELLPSVKYDRENDMVSLA